MECTFGREKKRGKFRQPGGRNVLLVGGFCELLPFGLEIAVAKVARIVGDNHFADSETWWMEQELRTPRRQGHC